MIFLLPQNGAIPRCGLPANGLLQPTCEKFRSCVLAFGDHATIDLGKIDCEGAEGDILRNATPDCLRRFRQIAMEYHDNASSLQHRELAGLLERAGFRTAVVERPSSPFGFIYAFRPVG